MKTIKHSIPNILSFTNAASGFIAMMNLIEGQYVAGILWMFLAVIFDAVDGKIASMLKVKSEAGAIIDMLADVISFGVLPGVGLFLFYKLAPGKSFILNGTAWVAGIGYTSAGLLREIRYITSQTDRERHQGFVGLAIAPPAGLNVAILLLVNLYPESLYTPFTLAFVFLLAAFHAYLMIRSEVIYYRWGMRGISIQFGTSIIAGIVTYFILKSFGAAMAIFFISVCMIYIYFHLLCDVFQRLTGKTIKSS